MHLFIRSFCLHYSARVAVAAVLLVIFSVFYEIRIRTNTLEQRAIKLKMLRTKIHIAISTIGVFLGLSAFICFCIIYANVEAGMWGLMSAIHAGLALMLHCHYLKESLHVNFSRKALQYIGDIGIVGFVSGTALTCFYIFMQCYYKTAVLPIDTSITIRLVWAFMMMKWGLLLYLTTKRYLRTYNDSQLFSENPNIEET